MKVEDQLIVHPGLQPRLQRTLFGILTFAAWSAYLYLWIPLATFLLWLGGLRISYVNLYLQSHEVNLWLLAQLLLLALVCAAVLLGWAEYNRIRFQGQDRRSRQTDAGLAEMAQVLGTSIDDARRLQTARIAVVVMDADANPLAVEQRVALSERTPIAANTPRPCMLPAVAASAPDADFDAPLQSQPAT